MLSARDARAGNGGLVFCLLAAGAAAGGCNHSGSYRVDWQFADQFQSGDCGRVGVSGISIAATRSDGSLDQRAVPCALGFYEGSLDEGSWTLTLVGLDATGNPKAKAPEDSAFLHGQTASAVEIQAGERAAAIPPVMLLPLPQCRDGVDNDLDGRVDLDDPDCAGSGDGLSECGSADGALCDDHAP